MKIRIVRAIVIKGTSPIKAYESMAGPTHEISVVSIDKGPSSIESEFDEALAVPAIISRISEAEREGCDAVVVNCFADPGVKPGRELVNIPVVGPGESAMHIASILGHKFSVLTVLENVIPTIYNNCKIYGLESKLASIRSIDVPVLSLHKDLAKVADALILESINAIRKDGAHCIALGCTGMLGLAETIQKGLLENGYTIPVIDPLTAALKMAGTLAEMKLQYSKLTYPFPPEKKIFGYHLGR